MQTPELTSIAALTIQSAGIILIAVLSFFIRQSIRRKSLDYWTAAWVCLSVALVALLVAFQVQPLYRVLCSVYLLGEYAFGLMFIAGCRNRAKGSTIKRRDFRWLILAAIVALLLPWLSDNFNRLIIFHAAIIGALFAWAFFSLQPARARGQSSPGLKVMSVALLLLALEFFSYVGIFTLVAFSSSPTIGYLSYSSVYDLILEILLGFGTVMVVMEDVQQEVEAANQDLTAARDRLEVLVKQDPLTEALNRHAFYSLLERNRDPLKTDFSGCVVIIDIDNLKPINDSIGHTAGDAVIRTVANVIRSVIRANDLLFRWGGDEFLILQFGVSATEVRGRIQGLNKSLTGISISGFPDPVTISVSFGLASFTGLNQIEPAIEQADSEMYASKQGRKVLGKEVTL
jgi:diguanylate cyclase (GGDEF)-like protein